MQHLMLGLLIWILLSHFLHLREVQEFDKVSTIQATNTGRNKFLYTVFRAQRRNFIYSNLQTADKETDKTS